MNEIFLKNYKYFKDFVTMLSNYKNEEEKLFFKVLSDDFLSDKYNLISKLKNETNASFFKQTILDFLHNLLKKLQIFVKRH